MAVGSSVLAFAFFSEPKKDVAHARLLRFRNNLAWPGWQAKLRTEMLRWGTKRRRETVSTTPGRRDPEGRR
jgi:hypothetical protein